MQPTTKTNLANVGIHYIKRLKIPVTRDEFKQRLEEDPSFPSLFSLKTVFDRYNIPNQAFNFKPESLDRLEPPFITYVKYQSYKDFALVTEMGEDGISFISENNRKKKINREEFIEMWENVVFVAEKNENSGDRNYPLTLAKENLRKRKKALLTIAGAIAAALLITLLLVQLPSVALPSALAILAIKLAGLSATVLLLMYDIDKTSQVVKNFCTSGKQLNCDAVLNSKAAQITGIRWSELGFFYFASTTLFLFIPGASFVAKIPWLSVANIVVVPYVLFSLYYQWRVIKQWCLLCLGVQAALLAELVWSSIQFWPAPVMPGITISSILTILLVLFIPPVLWYTMKPVLLKAKDEPGYQSAYKRLLYDPERFGALLQKQPAAPPPGDIGILIGNPAAAISIIKVCNPYCAPCARAHGIFEDILATNNRINLRIIFSANNDINDKRKKTVAHLLAIHSGKDASFTHQALHDWYSAAEKNYDTFAAKYPVADELNKQDEHIAAMYAWCKEAGITGTPTIFINGNKLPDNYSLEELKNIL